MSTASSEATVPEARTTRQPHDGAGGESLRLADLLLIGLSIALLTAFAELSILAVNKFVRGYTLHLSPSVVWMTPVACVALFAIPLVPLALLSRVWPRLGRVSITVGIACFLAVSSVMLVERLFALWAVLVLALGLAVQAGRMAATRRARVARITRRAAPALLALVLLSAAVVEVGSAMRERAEETGLPQSPANAPNVIFLILDTVRALNLGLYGYARETTPQLERLAERGVVYDHAIVAGTWTVPSHGSMFTGHWPRELASWWGPAGQPPFPTIAEFLRDRGYRTGGFAGNWYHIGRESGLAHGFLHYSDLGRSPAQIARGSGMVRWLSTRRWFKQAVGLYETLGRRRAPEVSQAFLRWVNDGSTRPFFAFLNYFDAHSPYLPPRPFNTRFGSGADREPILIEELNRAATADAEAVQAEVDAYDASIAYVDDEIGRLMDELERSGRLSNTIVIITADHGEELGEHGRWGHAYSMHVESLHVPLIVLAPSAPHGLRVTDPVSLRNIPLTIADLAGFAESPFPGTSLAAHWATTGDVVAPDTVLTEFGGYQSLYLEGYHFFTGILDDRPHLYDYRRDPSEKNDLMGTSAADSVLLRIRPVLEKVKPTKRPTGPAAPVPAEGR